MKVLSIITTLCSCMITINVAVLLSARGVEGASKLFPPERIKELEEHREWQRAEQIMEFLDIQEGYVVADIGTGAGYFALYLSDRVGKTGLVYAEDIQQEMVDYTAAKINNEEIKNIEVVLGKPDDPGLPENSLDLALMANMYHQVENPVALLKSVSRELKPDGRLIIIDWRSDRGSEYGPPMLDRIPEDLVESDAEEAGFYTVRRHPFLRHHYFIIFKKRSE